MSSLVRKISKRKHNKQIIINKNNVLISLDQSTYSIIRNSTILTSFELPAKFLLSLRYIQNSIRSRNYGDDGEQLKIKGPDDQQQTQQVNDVVVTKNNENKFEFFSFDKFLFLKFFCLNFNRSDNFVFGLCEINDRQCLVSIVVENEFLQNFIQRYALHFTCYKSTCV